MYKLSVIIPVYGVEKYIERCAESLFRQTLDNVEYIFVDDCTTDKSIDILTDVIAKNSSRFVDDVNVVRIVRMPFNSGLAAARRYGIQLAQGDYIIHCDSDDWVDVDLYQKMYDEAIRTRSDIVVCPICDEFEGSSRKRLSQKLPSSCAEVIETWYCNSISMYAWNKIVKTTVYRDNDILPFDEVNMWEDNGLMFRLFYYAKGLSQIDDSYYHYNRSNLNALTKVYSRNSIDQMIRCAYLLDDFFSSKSDSSKFSKTVLTLKYLAKINLITDNYDWLEEFDTIFPESNIAASWITKDAFSLKGRIRFWFVRNKLSLLFITLYRIKNRFIR